MEDKIRISHVYVKDVLDKNMSSYIINLSRQMITKIKY
jgi:hypothetical protein